MNFKTGAPSTISIQNKPTLITSLHARFVCKDNSNCLNVWLRDKDENVGSNRRSESPSLYMQSETFQPGAQRYVLWTRVEQVQQLWKETQTEAAQLSHDQRG